MRAVVGPLNRGGHRAVVGDLDKLDVLCFDRNDADVLFDASREPLEALWARLPSGFAPDCLIWWSPEYSLLPEGIERCPIPSIAVLGDWNLGLWTTAPLLEAFDWVVTDRMGVRTLASQLDVPVGYWRAFSFDSRLHRRRPGVDRDIDVLFVGNLNHDVHHERAPWLSRLARLGTRHRVHILSGVYGDDYAALLNRARIVWNRSIRGELNMRAYEAAACGAVLFLEEENLEVQDVFADRESCVLYNAANLEALVDHYLARPDLCARIAEAGWARVQRETYRDHLVKLLGDAKPLRTGRRWFASLPPWRRSYWLGLHALTSADPWRLEAAAAHLARASVAADPAAVAAPLGALAAAAAAATTDEDARARALASGASLLEAALRAHPHDVVSRINLAWIAAACGDEAKARREWITAREALRNGVTFPVDRPPVPFPYDRFRVEWERASVEPDVTPRMERFRPLLLARVSAALAGTEVGAQARIERWTESVAASPGIDGNVRALGEALEAAGEVEAAIEAFLRAVDLNPFDWPSRLDVARLARGRRERESVERLVADGSAVASGMAMYREAATALARLGGRPRAEPTTSVPRP
jgi:tetratricopeptide (TPR) repeat protein